MQPLAFEVGEATSFKTWRFYIFEVCHMHNTWFPLDPNRIVQLCDSSSAWLIVEILSTIESKNPSEIGSNLQPSRFLS